MKVRQLKVALSGFRFYQHPASAKWTACLTSGELFQQFETKIPTVVRAAPTMVTNMTGFLIIRRGLSFLKASRIAGPAMFQSKREGAFCFTGQKSFP